MSPIRLYGRLARQRCRCPQAMSAARTFPSTSRGMKRRCRTRRIMNSCASCSSVFTRKDSLMDILERDVRARQAQLEAARSGSQLPPPRPYDPAAEANLARANQAREAQRQALARRTEAARAKA